MADEIGFKSAAWSIDGARIDSALMRLLAYASTGGAEGIVAPGDCLVHQLAVPGTQIEIDTGALLILNRSANVKNQTYVADGSGVTRLDVQATTASGGRSDLVIVRLEDPEHGDWGDIPPGEEPDWQYVRPIILQNVPASTTSFDQLGLTYSAYALARIDIPASTGTITNAHITDLRKVARPRRETFRERYDASSGTDFSTSAILAPWEKFPATVPAVNILVPTWATKVNLSAWLTGMMNVDGNLGAYLRLALIGGVPSQTIITKVTYINEQTPSSERLNYLVGSTIDVPAAMRGRTCVLQPQFQKRAGAGRLRSDPDAQFVVDVEFIGAAS